MTKHLQKPHRKGNLALLIIVASLGYFVDIYDLILYNIIKDESLKSLGISLSLENVLFRWQMTGMLLGGLLWGIYGDKKGRVSVLFASIVLYSIANIANAFVTNIHTYSLWRFIAGVGLAGELGAAITLVSESMPQKKRGIGTMIIVTIGALGAVFAYFVSEKGHLIAPAFENVFSVRLQNWQTAYVIGGVLGLVLLILRAGTFESTMFHQLKEKAVSKGNFFSLFHSWPVFKKYIACILIGLPVWYVVIILVSNSRYIIPELGLLSGPAPPTKELVMYAYLGLSAGDLFSGLFSQLLHSRKKVIFIYLGCIVLVSAYFLSNQGVTPNYLRLICFLMGSATGYWALFVTNASEQFGTNIRSTVTATVPNFVRGGVVPITMGFEYLAGLKIGNHPYIASAAITGLVCLALAAWGTYSVKESFHKNLDYYE